MYLLILYRACSRYGCRGSPLLVRAQKLVAKYGAAGLRSHSPAPSSARASPQPRSQVCGCRQRPNQALFCTLCEHAQWTVREAIRFEAARHVIAHVVTSAAGRMSISARTHMHSQTSRIISHRQLSRVRHRLMAWHLKDCRGSRLAAAQPAPSLSPRPSTGILAFVLPPGVLRRCGADVAAAGDAQWRRLRCRLRHRRLARRPSCAGVRQETQVCGCKVGVIKRPGLTAA